MKNFLPLGVLLAALLLTIVGTFFVISDGGKQPPREKNGIKGSRLHQDLQLQAARLVRQGKFKEAEQLLLRLIRSFPGDFSSQKMLTKVYFFTGKSGKAEILLRKLAVLLPEDAVVRNNLGMVLVEKKQYESGIKELIEAERLSGDSRYVHFNLCRTCLLLGQAELAEKYRQEALAPNKGNEIPEEAIIMPERFMQEKGN